MDTPRTHRSFASVGYDEAVRRAESLIPLLKAEADASEKLTHMTPAVLNALHETGLLRYKCNSSAGIKMVLEAVDLLYEMAGANGIYDHTPLQRLYRDAHAGGAHINFNCDVNLSPWAIVSLGGEFKSPTL